eukprot:15482130-Alexandrium_andersonii.AAC.1
MGESAFTGQTAAPLRGDPTCCVKACSPIILRPSGHGPKRAPQGPQRGAGLPPGGLGHRTMYPELVRLSRLP